jgi:hypothetical protein
MNRTRFRLTARLLLLLANSGCSTMQVAVTRIGGALASGGSACATDNDVNRVGDALPFSLNTVESLLQDLPFFLVNAIAVLVIAFPPAINAGFADWLLG